MDDENKNWEIEFEDITHILIVFTKNNVWLYDTQKAKFTKVILGLNNG